MSIPCISADSVTSQMREIFACIVSKPLLLLSVQQTISLSTQREWAYTQLAFHCITGNLSETSLHPKPNWHCSISHRLHVCFLILPEITEQRLIVIQNTSEISCQVSFSHQVSDNQSHGHFLTSQATLRVTMAIDVAA